MINDKNNGNKIPNVPNLRFPEFSNNFWNNMKIKDILTIFHGRDYKNLDVGKIPVLGTGGIITYVDKYLCNWCCVLIGRKGTINRPQYMSEPFWCVDTLFYSKPKENNYPKFQFYLFETIDWNKNNEASGVPSLSASTIGNLKVRVPSLNEQIKISAFLTKIDDRIDTQNKIIEDLNLLINSIRYIIFSGNCKIFDATQVYYLKNFLTEYTKKNSENNLKVVSIGKYGIRMRDEIYSKELATDYSKNKVIFKDTLIIGMGSKQIDIGILSNDEMYCVSPAYTTYLINNINSKYLNEYLIFLNPVLSKRYMIIGARQGKSVNKTDLLNHKLKIHSEKEQQHIVDIFESLFTKLNKEKDILSLYKKQKAYLLLNMFI